MPEVPEPAIQPAAEVLLRQYESQYNADHLTWRDFADDARAILEAAAPAMAEAVAGKITAHMEAYAPKGDHVPSARRRCFQTAARVAAGAFSTREDKLREAAKALNEGNYAACFTREDDSDG